MSRRIAGVTALILGVLTVVVLLWQFRAAFVLFLLSLAAAAAVRPMIENLTARGIKRGLSIGIVYFVLLATLIAVLIGITGPLLGELQKLSDQAALLYDNIWQTWPDGTQFQQMVISRLPPPADLYEGLAGGQAAQVGSALLGFTANSAGAISQFFAMLILSLYWSIDRIHFERLWLSLLPVESRSRARDVWRNIEDRVGSYLRSEFAQSFLAGLLLAIGFSLMGLEYPIMMALIGAVAWLVPWIGALLALAPIFLIALGSGLPLAIGSAVFTVAVLVVMELVVEPRLTSRKVYSSLLVVMVMIAMGDAFGLIGVFLSPPLAAAIQLLVGSLLQPAAPRPEIDSLRKIAALDEQLEGVHSLLAKLPEEPSPQAVNMLSRLDALVARANEVLNEQSAQRTG